MRSVEMGNASIKWHTVSQPALRNSTEADPPYTHLQNSMQKINQLDLADCLKWIHHNEETNHDNNKLSKAMLQGMQMKSWIGMYIAIDEFKSYLPDQPRLKSKCNEIKDTTKLHYVYLIKWKE